LSVIFYILDIFPGTHLYDEFKNNYRVTDDIWLDRVEDIMYFETDPKFTQELILAFGKKLRTSFYENLPTFVDNLDLIDQKEQYPLHADFFSRLAMTFDHGDYADIDAIKGKNKIAETLYKRALVYYPDSRAYLGLGIIYQKRRTYQESIQILTEGLTHFPDDTHLNLCLATSLMNVGAYEEALTHLLPLQDSKQALQYIVNCYQALNDTKRTSQYLERLKSMQ
jgi:tetratricopeptide (TPR) repeat protein